MSQSEIFYYFYLYNLVTPFNLAIIIYLFIVSLQDHEILLAWLTDLHYEEYYELFISAGYDMPTISRMTPEDLTAIGIKKPNHRKRLKSEITQLNIPDGLPSYIPVKHKSLFA